MLYFSDKPQNIQTLAFEIRRIRSMPELNWKFENSKKFFFEILGSGEGIFKQIKQNVAEKDERSSYEKRSLSVDELFPWKTSESSKSWFTRFYKGWSWCS